MRQGQGGQRQDAVYLGVAVGVLVIAFLIIVGARALSPSAAHSRKDKDKKQTGDTAQADAKPTKKAARKPKPQDNAAGAPTRASDDPFISGSKRDPDAGGPYGRGRVPSGGPERPAPTGHNGHDVQPADQGRPEDPELTLELIGVVQGGTPLAIIRDGDRRYYLRVGETVGDYRLAKISSNRVVMTREGKSYTVDLQATRRTASPSSARRPVRPAPRPMRRR